jgi:uracil-DNA glycosylase
VGSRPAAERREELVALLREMREEHECPLAATRTNLVFGNGNADADLMFVGEAPGAREDEQGLPFVGRAGKLLDELLGEIGLSRQEVFVTNVLGCRPPGNRDPLPDEIDVCKPFLYGKIPLFHPAAALRTPSVLDALREDMARLPALLAEPAPEPPGAANAPASGPRAEAAPQLGLFG